MKEKLGSLCFTIKFHFIHKRFGFWLALLKIHSFIAPFSYLLKGRKIQWEELNWPEKRGRFSVSWTDTSSCRLWQLQASSGKVDSPGCHVPSNHRLRPRVDGLSLREPEIIGEMG